MAQSNVYSLNIVGYVNVNVTNAQLSLLSNPLKPSNGDYNITNTIKLQDPGSDSTIVYTWNSGASSWDSYTYVDGFGWLPDADINLGQGFFIAPTLSQTITFVGEVQTGNSTNAIPAGLTLLGNKVPVAGRDPGETTGNENDIIYTWDRVANSWNSTTFIAGLGWFDGVVTDFNGPDLQVADGFFYLNTGSSLEWIQTLNP